MTVCSCQGGIGGRGDVLVERLTIFEAEYKGKI
jgi:hypothetical protein